MRKRYYLATLHEGLKKLTRSNVLRAPIPFRIAFLTGTPCLNTAFLRDQNLFLCSTGYALVQLSHIIALLYNTARSHNTLFRNLFQLRDSPSNNSCQKVYFPHNYLKKAAKLANVVVFCWDD